ncbi:PH domain-containing protein [Streptomyces sp. B6B3]|uniref:PH domain-containing protein n=1 Tax=Streptomyces sp. B6B3 TaxID=3153570 RepID=UPI00325CFA3C
MAAEFPRREYRAMPNERRWQIAGVAVTVAAPVIGSWTWPTADGFWWLGPLVTCCGLGVFAWLVRAVRRSGTTVDETGIRVRGILRATRLRWDEILDIRSVSVPADEHGRGVATHAYRADGSLVTLAHLDGLQPAYQRELELVRERWEELRGPGTRPLTDAERHHYVVRRRARLLRVTGLGILVSVLLVGLWVWLGLTVG